MNKKSAFALATYPVEADLAYIVANRDEFVEEYYGLAVLVHDQKVVGSFKSVPEACTEGAKRFGDGEFSVHNMLDYRCEEDKKWDETLDGMTEEESAELGRMFDRIATGDGGPLDFTDK